jgi:hypothetical protein
VFFKEIHFFSFSCHCHLQEPTQGSAVVVVVVVCGSGVVVEVHGLYVVVVDVPSPPLPLVKRQPVSACSQQSPGGEDGGGHEQPLVPEHPPLIRCQPLAVDDQ